MRSWRNENQKGVEEEVMYLILLCVIYFYIL